MTTTSGGFRARFVLKESFQWYLDGEDPGFHRWFMRLSRTYDEFDSWYNNDMLARNEAANIASGEECRHATRQEARLEYVELIDPPLRVLTLTSPTPDDAAYLEQCIAALTRSSNPAYIAPLDFYTLPEARALYAQASTGAATQYALWLLALLAPPSYDAELAALFAEVARQPAQQVALYAALTWVEWPELSELQADLLTQPVVTAVVQAQEQREYEQREVQKIRFTAPSWLPSLQAAPELRELQAHFFDEEELRRNNPATGNEASSWVSIGALEGQNYATVYLLLNRAQPNQLWYSFQSLSSQENTPTAFLRMTVEPTVAGLRELHTRYVAPSFTLPVEQYGLAAIAQLRYGQPRQLTSPHKQQLRLVVGFGNYHEAMVQLEHALVLIPFLATQAFCQATTQNGNQDRTTQHPTRFSASLLSLTRMPNPLADEAESAVFVVDVEYIPYYHQELLAQCRQNGTLDEQLASLPDDMPLDVLGALLSTGFPILWTEQQLLECALGRNSLTSPAHAVQLLAPLVPDAELTATFAPVLAVADEATATQLARLGWQWAEAGQGLLDALRQSTWAGTVESTQPLVIDEAELQTLAATWLPQLSAAPDDVLRRLYRELRAVSQQHEQLDPPRSLPFAEQAHAVARELQQRHPADSAVQDMYFTTVYSLAVMHYNMALYHYDQAEYEVSYTEFSTSCDFTAELYAGGYKLPGSFIDDYIDNLNNLASSGTEAFRQKVEALLERFEAV